ncbi:MAG: EthD family reductase [Alphaproteobacteria bacterium]|nr:EthD family reductase [Alphaproteobacteria bacterium]
MLKFAAFFRKRPDLSHAQFQRYWLERHAEVVLRLPGLARYVQNHPLPATLPPSSPCHGVAEVWLEDAGALDRNPADPYWEEVGEDEARFIDQASLVVLPVAETAPKSGEWPRPGIKVLRTLSAMDGKVPPVAVLPTVRRYLRNGVTSGEGFCRGYDCTWFNSLADAHAVAAKMKDPAAMHVMIATEHVIKA